MDKVAMVKQAEVNGVIAGLVDQGYVKLASENDFNLVCNAVASNLSDEWDFNEVIEKTAAVMEEINAIYEEIGINKTASNDEYTAQDILAAYGELTLQKQAEEIDDETYEEKASALQKALAALKENKGKVIGGLGAAAALGALGYAGLNNGKVKAFLTHTDKPGGTWSTLKDILSNSGKKIPTPKWGKDSKQTVLNNPKVKEMLPKMQAANENAQKLFAAKAAQKAKDAADYLKYRDYFRE